MAICTVAMSSDALLQRHAASAACGLYALEEINQDILARMEAKGNPRDEALLEQLADAARLAVDIGTKASVRKYNRLKGLVMKLMK